MFSKYRLLSLKSLAFFLIFTSFLSCEEDVFIAFSETNILVEKETTVEINIPKAEGDKPICDKINASLQGFVIQALNIDSASDHAASIKESIAQFDTAYTTFKSKLPIEIKQDLTPWEASIEGEVAYESNHIICIAMNKYLNTGGVHGTAKVSFMNFDPKTGHTLQYKDFVKDTVDLRKFLKFQFEKAVEPIAYENFKLPETIGFNDEGVVILYNVNEMPAYTDRLTEFTVPYKDIKKYLKFD